MICWRFQGVSPKISQCSIFHSHNCTGDGGVLTGRRPPSVSTDSDIFLHILGNIVRCFPEAQSDPFLAWQVRDALSTATFSEWTKFKKSNSQDTFHSASQCFQKAGSRDARYAKVNRLPPSEVETPLMSSSIRLSTWQHPNQAAYMPR